MSKKEEQPNRFFESSAEHSMFAYTVLRDAYERRGLRSVEVGDTLYPTAWAIENGVLEDGDIGEVVGFGRNDTSIRVRKNDNKTPYNYWAGFWKKNKPQTYE